MTTTSTEFRIYIACLHCYNGGKLHGYHFDPLDSDLEEQVTEKFDRLPSQDEDGNYQTPWLSCGGEELMVHDHEGFNGEGFSMGEVGISEAVEIAEFIEAAGDSDAARFALDQHHGDVDAARDYLDNHLRGRWGSVREFAEHEADRLFVRDGERGTRCFAMDNVHILDVPLSAFIDWDQVIASLESSYNIHECDDGDILVFDC